MYFSQSLSSGINFKNKDILENNVEKFKYKIKYSNIILLIEKNEILIMCEFLYLKYKGLLRITYNFIYICFLFEIRFPFLFVTSFKFLSLKRQNIYVTAFMKCRMKYTIWVHHIHPCKSLETQYILMRNQFLFKSYYFWIYIFC